MLISRHIVSRHWVCVQYSEIASTSTARGHSHHAFGKASCKHLGISHHTWLPTASKVKYPHQQSHPRFVDTLSWAYWKPYLYLLGAQFTTGTAVSCVGEASRCHPLNGRPFIDFGTCMRINRSYLPPLFMRRMAKAVEHNQRRRCHHHTQPLRPLPRIAAVQQLWEQTALWRGGGRGECRSIVLTRLGGFLNYDM